MTSCGAAAWSVLLPTFDALHSGRTPPLVAGARRAEELGFDGGWVGDHLICNSPVLDASMALAAAAAVTRRLALGFSIMLLGLRTPAQAASQVATLASLSGDRLSLGVGVGGEYPEEFAAAGVSVNRRGRRLDEMLDALPELLGGRVPRIIVGGRGEPAHKRAARVGDAWLPMWLSPDAIRDGRDRVRELAAAAGRPAPAIVLLVLACVEDDIEAARRNAAAHLDGQYGLPLHVVEKWAALGTASAVAEQLEVYLDAGVDELILMPLGGRPLEQYERFAEVRGMLGKKS